ncbi:indole-3-glycerol phosphate synthase TrpC [Aureivirga sp. CE67]|uniref:indole-3-glycerol phosphate synthase TrpC n=1 Tax=Aureivirga sp. CE67 TaxID=1788983 RepID=UPI0018CBA15E|nr:indole-3-glycerol phosphate synthase TrpC [Aureivirga sp. CE67]
MENILDKIVAYKKQEVEKFKAEVPLKKLIESPNFKRKTISLKDALTRVGGTGIIAEYKRKSPSKGVINSESTIADVTKGYLKAGVAAQSILTDTAFFGGNMMDLMLARVENNIIPILRKDFIVDAFQIVEAKAIGADAILLIASILNKEELKHYGKLAEDLGLEVLYEVHDERDLDKLELSNKIIGVNNRDLKSFAVSVDNSLRLSEMIPASCVKVSESGISDIHTIRNLQQVGFRGFLMGEHFMSTDNPGLSCQNFIKELYPTKP